jgi:hypothetical protein
MTNDPIPKRLRADLWVETPGIHGSSVEFACRLEYSNGDSHRIWFRFPPKQDHLLTRLADPMVVAVLLHAMRRCRELVVHGRVSAGLISNLCSFQEAFCAYHGGAYHPVRIEAEYVDEPSRTPRSARAITAFSGGVDGTFNLYRHTDRSRIVPKRPLHAALLMQGMDVPLSERAVFAEVTRRCRVVAEDAGVTLHTGSTNLRVLAEPWEEQFGSAVAASLLFFQDGYTHGLIASAYSYGRLHPEHGSNPLTDPLLSSPLLTIVHDGAAYGRIEKLRELTAWPAAIDNLRVCWQPGRADNCGHCEKCIRTQLMLFVCGVEHCAAFGAPVSNEDISNLVIRTASGLNELSYLVREAETSHPEAWWIVPVTKAISRNKRYLRLQSAARKAGETIPGWLRTTAGSIAKKLFAQDGRETNPDAPDSQPAVPLHKAQP